MTDRIASVEAIPFVVPFLPRFRRWKIAGRTNRGMEGYVLVRLRTDSGLCGLGEAGRYCDGETPVSICWAVRELAAPLLVGTRPTEVGATMARLRSTIRGNPYALAAAEMALLDLLGRQVGLSLSSLLGDRVHDRVPVSARVGVADTIDAAVRAAKAAVADGYRCIKLKVGDDARRDVDLVREVRAAVGPEIALRLDANEGYRRHDERTLRALDDARILVIEQPLPAADLFGMRRLTRILTAPVMADEAATSPADAYNLARAEAVTAIQVKVGKAGGLRSARAMVDVARACGLSVGVGSMLECGVGSAAVLHLAATIPELPFPLETTGAHTFAEGDILTTRLAPKDGVIEVPTGPGLGVDVDEESLRAHQMEI